MPCGNPFDPGQANLDVAAARRSGHTAVHGRRPGSDSKLFCSLSEEEAQNAAGTDLIPLSIPPLRGRLTLMCLTCGRLVRVMIAVFGTPFSTHGSVQGEVYAASFGGMRRNAGDAAVVPDGPGW